MKVKKWFPFLVVFVGVLCWGTIWRILLQSKSVLGISTDLSSSQIIALTNLKRLEAGLTPLHPNDSLSAAAQAKLDDMIARDYFAHLDPSGIGSDQFLDQQSYGYSVARENLARNFLSSQAVVEAWMASPDHRKNLLNENYLEIGVAVAQNDNRQLVVQLLASPLPVDLKTLNGSHPPISFTKPLVGSTLLTDNYFLSTLILSLAIVLFLGIITWPAGKYFGRKIFS